MQKGVIRRRGRPEVIGRWQADTEAIVVETEDPDLRRAADAILTTPQRIPLHAPELYPGVSFSEDVVEPPAKIKYLALFAMELEERGFELEPEE